VLAYCRTASKKSALRPKNVLRQTRPMRHRQKYSCLISVLFGGLFIGTGSSSVRSRVYVTVRCPSVSLSQHGPTAANPLVRVCCCGIDGQEISIDCCVAGAQQQRRAVANASSATLSAYVERSTQTCINKKLRYRRRTARRDVPVEILPTVA